MGLLSLGSILQPFHTRPLCGQVYDNAPDFHLVLNSLD